MSETDVGKISIGLREEKKGKPLLKVTPKDQCVPDLRYEPLIHLTMRGEKHGGGGEGERETPHLESKSPSSSEQLLEASGDVDA